MKYYTSLKAFYCGDDFNNLRNILIDQRTNENGEVICEHCGEPIYKKYDLIAHHTTELTIDNVNDAEISLNPKKIQLIHHKCHNIIHNRFQSNSYKRVYLVHGSPFAGKEAYVRNIMSTNDVIVSVDNIWQMITNNKKYIKPDTLKPIVFNIYNTAIDNVVMRTGQWNNAYVIVTMARLMDRVRLIERLGAEEIHIDTSKDDCIKNLIKSEAPQEKYLKYIEDYWHTLQIIDKE